MPNQTCKHFGVCGGCALLNLSYDEQVARKQAKLQDILRDFWTQKIPVTQTDNPFYFRNKVELGFCHQVKWREDYNKKDPANKTRPLEFEQALGFKYKGRFDRAVEISECLLFSDKLVPLLNALRAWAAAENLPYYDTRKHTGVLRHLLVREGKNTGEHFLDLLKALDQVEGIERYRISSIEPDLLDDEVIDWCSSSRAFMPHFHIPLQSGSDEVLQLMRRHYTRDLFARKVERIHQVMPHAFIGVDVMVGTRGETPECFDDSLQFIASLGVQHLHVFPYSERPGTMALRIPYIVPKAVRDERVARMMELSERQQREFIERHLGTERPVLFEQPLAGSKVMHGFTDNYIRVTVPYREELVNKVSTVMLESSIVSTTHNS